MRWGHGFRHIAGAQVIRMTQHAVPRTTREQGTAFPYSERDRLGLRGLIPPVKLDLQLQVREGDGVG